MEDSGEYLEGGLFKKKGRDERGAKLIQWGEESICENILSYRPRRRILDWEFLRVRCIQGLTVLVGQ